MERGSSHLSHARQIGSVMESSRYEQDRGSPSAQMKPIATVLTLPIEVRNQIVDYLQFDLDTLTELAQIIPELSSSCVWYVPQGYHGGPMTTREGAAL